MTPIPDRPAFKAAEVCEIAQIPPYVLRSWEKEFPNLGVPAKPGGVKVYRRADVEQVLRIKQLLFSEGLTLAGARRKLEGEPPPEPEGELTLPIPEDVRTKVATVKRELRSLLDLLESGPSGAAPGAEARSAEASGGGASGAGARPVEAPGAEAAPAAPRATNAGAAGAAGGGPSSPAEAATPPGTSARPHSTWPPAPAAARKEEASLPLLNGTAEEPAVPAESAAPPPKPRRTRRPAKG